MSELIIDMPSSDGADLESLVTYLRSDASFPWAVETASGPVAPGVLGASTEVLTVLLGAGGAGAILASAVRAWAGHAPRSRIMLRISRPGGAHIEIDADRVTAQDVALLLKATETDRPADEFE